ncbi:MAG: Maf family protein [Opitutaceae bacterium]
MSKHPDKLILASASPRRSELLERMGLAFEVHPSHADEDDSGSNGPEQMVLNNAALKADAMVDSFPDALVLGSDTTVALGESVLSKPADLAEAKAMLRRLSGNVHTVYTAVALRWSGGAFSETFVGRSRVRFKELSDEVIDTYFGIVNPLDKAGAYGIQEGREWIIESVEGSVENVMGLPIQALAEKFAEHRFDFRDES